MALVVTPWMLLEPGSCPALPELMHDPDQPTANFWPCSNHCEPYILLSLQILDMTLSACQMLYKFGPNATQISQYSVHDVERQVYCRGSLGSIDGLKLPMEVS